MEDAPQRTLRDARVELLHRGGEAPVEARHPDAACAARSVHHHLGFGAGHRERLLAEHVGARREGADGDHAVQVGRRRDDDDLGLGLLDHLLPSLEDVRHAVAVGDRLRAHHVALADGDDAATVGLKRGDVGAAEAEHDDADRERVLGHGSVPGQFL